jgi:hypothetical protein
MPDPLLAPHFRQEALPEGVVDGTSEQGKAMPEMCYTPLRQYLPVVQPRGAERSIAPKECSLPMIS